MYENYLNRRVLVRSTNAGVYFGTLEAVDYDTVKLSDVRNIWYWTGANCLSDIANHGVGANSKISAPVKSTVLLSVCQIILLTDEAINNLESYPVWTF